jgi:transcriptional regulator with XRE-family HTH domain
MRTLHELARSLEQARRGLGLSYDALARAAGLTPLATRRALQGGAAPRITTVMALAEHLGLEVVVVPQAVAQGLAPSPAEALARPLSAVEKLTAAPDTGRKA